MREEREISGSENEAELRGQEHREQVTQEENMHIEAEAQSPAFSMMTGM